MHRALIYYPCQLSLSFAFPRNTYYFFKHECLLAFFILVCKSVPVFMSHVYAFQIKTKILLLLQTKANLAMIWRVLNSYSGRPRPEKALQVRALSQLGCAGSAVLVSTGKVSSHLSGGWTAGQGLGKQSSFCCKIPLVWLVQWCVLDLGWECCW